MARIGIDAHAIGSRLTGNETYIANLIKSLAAIDSGNDYVLMFTLEEAARQWSGRFEGMETVMVSANPLVRIPLQIPRIMRSKQLDLLHVQYVSPPLMSNPCVVMVHDISFEHYPEYFTRKEAYRFKATIPFSARRAEVVLTVSDYSKRDIVTEYGIDADRVIVTPDGVGPEFQPVNDSDRIAAVKAAYGIDDDYILTVSNLQPRKNLVRLVRAYERLRDSEPGIRHKMVIVGKKAWKFDPILAFVSESRWSGDIILTDYVEGGDLPVLYAGADLFVYVSIFEGFGLPPLEAMACGTPTVVSDRSSLPEVVGSAGIKVDPFDIEGIAAAMAVVLLDEDTAALLSRRGLERAGKFTWEECARRTLSGYAQALSS